METRFCPQCGSTNVEPDTTNPATVSGHGGSSNQWKCKECDYSGFMPVGDPEDDFEDVDFEGGQKDDEYNRVSRVRGSALSYRLGLVFIFLIFLWLAISEGVI